MTGVRLRHRTDAPPARGWRRDLALTLRLTRLNILVLLEYRTELILNVTIGAVWQLGAVVFVMVVMGRFSHVGVWTQQEVILIASMRLMSHGLYVLVNGRLPWVQFLIQEGRFDAFLLRPMSVLRQVQLAMFPANALGDLLVGVAMLAYALSRSHLEWTPLRIVLLAVFICGGALVETAIETVVAAAALHFVTTSMWNAWIEELTATFGGYPLSVFPNPLQWIFTVVLPLSFVSYFPVAVLTGHTDALPVSSYLAWASPAVGIFLLWAARKVWNRSLRSYTGSM
jgi:ABC-2 type transport system permease protein